MIERLKIVLLAAVTADGKMARNSAQLSNWTSHEDKKIFVAESRRAGVIILGNSTYKTLPFAAARPPAHCPHHQHRRQDQHPRRSRVHQRRARRDRRLAASARLQERRPRRRLADQLAIPGAQHGG
nr:RibD C-terminal domain protein [uncultured bacterium]